MLIQPADGSPGIFVDKLRVEAVVAHDSSNYRVVFVSGASVLVSRVEGERLLTELAGK